jgi:hypothetical protein
MRNSHNLYKINTYLPQRLTELENAEIFLVQDRDHVLEVETVLVEYLHAIDGSQRHALLQVHLLLYVLSQQQLVAVVDVRDYTVGAYCTEPKVFYIQINISLSYSEQTEVRNVAYSAREVAVGVFHHHLTAFRDIAVSGTRGNTRQISTHDDLVEYGRRRRGEGLYASMVEVQLVVMELPPLNFVTTLIAMDEVQRSRVTGVVAGRISGYHQVAALSVMQEGGLG